MKTLPLAACPILFFLCAGLTAAPFKLPHQSVSASKQFVIYCDDLAMRLAVSSFAENTKSGVLDLLALQDHWKIPVVINLVRKDVTQPDQPISQVHLIDLEGGATKIELDVALGGDLSGARFQQQLVRAILLALEYQDKPAGANVTTYIDPPPWLVEGITAYLRNRNAASGSDVDVYKALLAKNSLPAISDFLVESPSEMNAASLKLYQAYALSFLQLLAGLPGGQACLVSYISDLPLGTDAPAADLIKHFPSLHGSDQTLGKWWTLSLANISASDRYKGLSQEETEKRLTALLKFTIPVKTGEPKVFAVEEYKDFMKLPQARTVLANAAANLQALSAQSAPLYRPITGEYHDIVAQLQLGKTKHMDVRLKNVAKYREMISIRTEQVADYLNWFEATQMVTRSNSFEDYMKTANELSKDAPKRDDAISKYLDGIELQLQ